MMGSIEAAPEVKLRQIMVRNKHKFITLEKIKSIRTANGVSRTQEEVEDIKEARVKRKEERAIAKAAKARNKAENHQFWQKKINAMKDTAASEENPSLASGYSGYIVGPAGRGPKSLTLANTSYNSRVTLQKS